MTHRLDTRVSKLEEYLYVGPARQEHELRKRRHYNLSSVSDESLCISAIASHAGFPEPEWVTREFEKPIPPDAPRNLIHEAEHIARHSSTKSHEEVSRFPLSDFLATLSFFTGRTFSDPIDVRNWLNNEGKNYIPHTGNPSFARGKSDVRP